ncbi:MAG: NAD-dependent epimerase/dehydratase family protein [Magnetococcales bacterium]|nr:NAD-dependent epimerase/dehydratase family protein [Magnetococcales bacterium]MBF0149108.1 NAD-dependent epimerase/dehydratase family protein [Magnetococcales bacterium]MBF0173239.1 NAD-dependent epimerase/dehydratase family protein [Magnetococcales bacterium]MBF0347647.1 NAD-dependent epimerase/dehydratase family protein [Magnetococcales bacterium]MBF0632247.1 NAD-dependent epimerase/dehydratase family protein [Magnetococcales bacterium]
MALYLITGGCGFIGSHLADALVARGDRVRVLDDLSTGSRENLPEGVELRVGDVADGEAVRDAMSGVAGCWHLAAIASVARSNEEWLWTHRVNQTGSVQVFDAARRAGPQGTPIPVVFASSAAVYGDNPHLPLAEHAATRPLTAYGADKLGSELHAAVATRVHGVPTVGFRFFNVYGRRQDPRSPYSGVISIFAGKILARQPLTIFGDGSQTRDFVHVSDVVHFLLAGMGRGRDNPEIYNVCTGRQTSVNQLVRFMLQEAGYPVPVAHAPPRAGDIRHSLGDPTMATRNLGLIANHDMAAGLGDLLVSLAADHGP